MQDNERLKGRGAQKHVANSFQELKYEKAQLEAIDDWTIESPKTKTITVYPKSIVNPVTSPDVGMEYSANPYQGCEHGCVYCYARNSHQYWGYDAGLDFESKILVKANCVKLFKQFITRKTWKGSPISLSGNTDCYQPVERRFQLTRGILKTALEYGQPIELISKNSLMLRDLDILSALAEKSLVRATISINSLNKHTRAMLEPRTASGKSRLHLIERLSSAGIPVSVMCAPIIPGLTDTEIPSVLKAVSEAGAKWANYTIVRLNGQIADLFSHWLEKSYPERFHKIWNSIQDCHNGQVNDSRFENRMKGTGQIAQIIAKQFSLHCKLNGLNQTSFSFDLTHFNQRRNPQLSLFH